MSARRVPAGRALVVALVALAFCGLLETLDARFFLRDDNSTYYLPAYVHNHRTLVESGTPALVNPHQLLGVPHLAAAQPAVLYPPVYAAVQGARTLGDERWTLELLAAVHLVAGAVGMLFLLRHLGLGRPARGGGDVAGALLWVTTPFLVLLSRAWIPFAYAGAFLPWSLLLLLCLLESPSRGRMLAYGSVKTLFLFGGYPQLLLYSTLLEAAVWCGTVLIDARTRRRAAVPKFLRQAAVLAGAALWTTLTSAPLLLPMFEAVRVSFMRRTTLPVDVFGEFPMAAGDFLAAQIFVFRDDVFLTAGSSIFFVGPLFLGAFLAALVAIWLRPTASQSGRTPTDPEVALDCRLRVLAVVACLAFLASTSMWRWLYGLPVISSFRWPAKNFLFFVFASLPAVCWAYERLHLRKPRWAAAALVLSLTCSLGVILPPANRVSMGEATLDEPVTHYEGHLAQVCPGEGRIAALRKDGTLSAEDWDVLAPYLGAYNYATLFGRHQIGGYEPMVSEMHFQLSAGMNYTATLPLRRAGPELWRHLAHWGVTCVLVPDLPGVAEALAGSGLRRRGTWRSIASYELDGLPVASWVRRNAGAAGATGSPSGPDELSIRWTTVGLSVETRGAGGTLRLAVAPMSHWDVTSGAADEDTVTVEWRLDSSGLLVDVPPGHQRFELVYRDPMYRIGLWIACLSVLLALLVTLLTRVADRSD